MKHLKHSVIAAALCTVALAFSSLGFVSCASTYYVGTEKYDKVSDSNFTAQADEEGNLLIKRASKFSKSLVPTYVFLDGNYFGKIGSGDWWQGNIEEGEHEIAVAFPGTIWETASTPLESYPNSWVDRATINISSEKTTVLWIQLKSSFFSNKFTITEMDE